MSAKVKICGITRLEDAKLALELGAEALGFNFYEKSPRCISAEDAASIIRLLPPKARFVGVFVNHSKEEVEQIARRASLDTLQFHGDEPVDFYSQFKSWDVIRAIRLQPDTPKESILAAKENSEFLLFDSFSDSAFGGTGEAIESEVLELVKDLLPEAYLAGGITAENVAEKIERYKPYAVDVASGVEKSPGIKSASKLERLFQAIS